MADMLRMCRLCGGDAIVGVSLLDPSHHNFSKETTVSFNLEINSSNGFPTKICHQCFKKVKDLIVMKETSLLSHQYFCALLQLSTKNGLLRNKPVDVSVQTDNQNFNNESSNTETQNEIIGEDTSTNTTSEIPYQGPEVRVTRKRPNNEIITKSKDVTTSKGKKLKIMLSNTVVQKYMANKQKQSETISEQQEVEEEVLEGPEEIPEIQSPESQNIPSPQNISENQLMTEQSTPVEIAENQNIPDISPQVQPASVENQDIPEQESTPVETSENQNIPSPQAQHDPIENLDTPEQQSTCAENQNIPETTLPLHLGAVKILEQSFEESRATQSTSEPHFASVYLQNPHLNAENSPQPSTSHESNSLYAEEEEVQIKSEMVIEVQEWPSLPQDTSNDVSNSVFDENDTTTSQQSPDDRDEPSEESVFSVCEICQNTYNLRKELKQHLCMDHQINEKEELMKYLSKCFKCVHCDKGFPSRNVLTFHIKNIHNSSDVTCDSCNKTFKTLSSLYYHKTTFHGPKNLKCDVCGKILKNNRSLYEHKQRHYKKKSTLNSKHGNESSNNETKLDNLNSHSDPSSFQCNECQKTYKSRKTLENHTLAKHDNKKTIMSSCNKCEKKFKSKNYLKIHTLRVHNIKKKWECNECQKSFKYQLNLKKHKLVSHSKSKPIATFNCQYCDRVFKNKTFLNVHVTKIHVNVKKQSLKCYDCGVVFKRRQTLKTHKCINK